MANAQHAVAPLGGRLVTPVTVVLAGLTAIAGVILLVRFFFGLGAVTNISDGFPWGIWIAYDVMVGSALACGGYAMALLVYIFNRGEYHPLVRPALLASLFGYTLAGASVIFDLGRYWNVWHLFWPGYAQINSVMFEVGVCITAYIFVMWIEFSPVFLEKLGLKDVKRKLSKVLFFFIALGVLLPSMHQSSLGSLLVVFGYQVHPLWQTVLLPLLFLLTAILLGFAVVIFEASVVSVGFKRPGETPLLARLSRIMYWTAGGLSGGAGRGSGLARRARAHVRAQLRSRRVLGRDAGVRRAAVAAGLGRVAPAPRPAVRLGRAADAGRLHAAHQRLSDRLRDRPRLALFPVGPGTDGDDRPDRLRNPGLHRVRAHASGAAETRNTLRT